MSETEKWLQVSKIIADPDLSVRDKLSEETVNHYAELMEDGVKFPPVVVFTEGLNYWLADGFHRLAAIKVNCFPEIHCEIHRGGKREALLYAVGANTAHGLQRSNADKRRAVQILLRDPEWVQWSDGAIAKHAGVSGPYVGVRRKALVQKEEIPNITKRIVKNGDMVYVAEMKTSGRRAIETKAIGKVPKFIPPPVTPKRNENYVKNWAWYLVRFTPEQFVKWQETLALRCSISDMAEAVDVVMREPFFAEDAAWAVPA